MVVEYANQHREPQWIAQPGVHWDYTVFGRITRGLDILTRVAGAGSDNANGQGDGKPNQPVVLQQVTVTKAGS